MELDSRHRWQDLVDVWKTLKKEVLLQSFRSAVPLAAALPRPLDCVVRSLLAAFPVSP